MNMDDKIWLYMTPNELFGMKPKEQPVRTRLEEAEHRLNTGWEAPTRAEIQEYVDAKVEAEIAKLRAELGL